MSEIVDDNDRVRQLEIVEKRKEEEQIIISNLPEEIHVPVTLRKFSIKNTKIRNKMLI